MSVICSGFQLTNCGNVGVDSVSNSLYRLDHNASCSLLPDLNLNSWCSEGEGSKHEDVGELHFDEIKMMMRWESFE